MTNDQSISNEQVRAQLERVLASRGFANAGRLSRLLRHVVEKTLAGEADQLKEYSVGMDVFDRDEKYDPRVDSIVRVEAGRLRSRLDEYYGIDGTADPVRISLPRGAYVALFAHPTPAPIVEAAAGVATPASPRRIWTAWAMTAGLVGITLVVVAWLGKAPSTQGQPSVAVLAFEQYSAGDEDGAVAAQLTDSVTAELARLGTVSVVSHTSAMQFAGERRSVREIAQTLGASFIVEGSIENDAAGIRVMTRLVNGITDRKVWVEEFAGKASDLRGLSRNIAAGVSEALSKASSPQAP